MNIWAKLKAWWENKKGVIVDFVIPQLNAVQPDLEKYLIERGIPKTIANPASIEAINFVIAFLKRQI